MDCVESRGALRVALHRRAFMVRRCKCTRVRHCEAPRHCTVQTRVHGGAAPGQVSDSDDNNANVVFTGEPIWRLPNVYYFSASPPCHGTALSAVYHSMLRSN